VTWRVGNACRFGEQVGHALEWKIKSVTVSASGLPVNRATIRPIDLLAC
jgi:hypothetical protein